MPGSGKSLELISLIAATKNRIAPPATELTGFGPFVPEIEAYVPLHQSQESRAYIPSLLETCVRVVREKTALSSEDITSVQSTSAAEMLAGTELTFKRPDPVLFKDLTFPSRRSSQRTNEHWGTRDLHNMPSTVTHISKTSLIVVPANLIDHWKEEIETAHKHQLSYEKARKGHGDKPIREWTSDQLLEVEKQFFWTILTESDHKSGLMRPAELAKFDLLLMSELVFQKRESFLLCTGGKL